MSSNKTPNYNLHSWLAGDDFRLHEINENFTALDRELALETKALQDAFADEVGELRTALAGKADAAAVNALTETVRTKGELVVGSWSGLYNANPVIDLGKPIKALLLENADGWRGALFDSRLGGGLVLPGHRHHNGLITVTGTQFAVGTWCDEKPTWSFTYMAWLESV